MNGSLLPVRLALGVSGSLLSLGLALAQGQAPAGSQPQATNAPGAVSAPAQAGQRQANQGQANQGQAAQGRPGRGQQGQGQAGMRRQGMQGGARIGDREMAEALLVSNQGEVAMAQFALQKTENQEVRKFAEKLVEDHQKMIDKLRQAGAGGGAAAAPGDSADQPAAAGQAQPAAAGQAQPAANTTDQAGVENRRNSVNPGAAELQPGRQGRMGRGTDFVSLKQELGQQCLQSSQRELGSKQGAEFDKCYIGMQIGAHQHAVDTLTVFRRHASDQLGGTIDEGLPVVQAHLEHAKQLMKQLESGSPSKAASSDQPKQ